jgi:hypothetical protein
MSDETYKMVLTDESWHGYEDAVVSRNISVAEGCELAKLAKVVWVLRPAFVETDQNMFVPIKGKSTLVRLPTPWDNTYHILGNRLVRDYEIVDNTFLCGLATQMADVTGWSFEGAGTLKRGEISFIQLRLTNNFYVGGKEHEAHRVKFLFGDDKRNGAGYGGLVLTRLQCWNTWRMAIAEDGIFKIPHRDDPHAQWNFVNARIEAAIGAAETQKQELDRFFVTSIQARQFQAFVEGTFPTPEVPKAIAQAEEARALIEENPESGDDLAHMLFRGNRAQEDYENKYALAERRREALERGFAQHNIDSPDSANTLYAAFNGLTHVANYAPSNVFRGKPAKGLLFNGTRGQFVDRGYNLLKELLAD